MWVGSLCGNLRLNIREGFLLYSLSHAKRKGGPKETTASITYILSVNTALRVELSTDVGLFWYFGGLSET